MSEPQIDVRAAHDSGPQSGWDRIVYHDEEYPVSVTSAEDIARYFADPSAGGSIHYAQDGDGEQHCVPDLVIAWHAPPNDRSVGQEQDGYARYKRADWFTDGSKHTICRTCARAAELHVRGNVPVVRLFAGDLLAGRRGYCGHGDVSAAWGQSDHTDPGPAYPFDVVEPLVKLGISRLASNAAVRAFQAERRIAVDGDPGRQTVLALGDFLYEHWMTPGPKPVPVPSSNRFAPMATVAQGDVDPAGAPTGRVILDYSRPVQSLQAAVNVCDRKDTTGLVLDGDFGPGTAAAVKRYQGFFLNHDGKHPQAVDGVAGPATWGLLDWLLDSMHR